MKITNERNEEIFCYSIELRGVPQSFHAGNSNAPGESRDGSVELLIDEIPESPEREPERNGDDDEIAECEEWNLVLPRHVGKREERANESSVACHATMPDHENFEGIAQVLERIVEKHVAEAPADEHADDCPSEDIAPDFFGERNVSIALQSREQEVPEDEAREVEEPVPVDRKPEKGEGDCAGGEERDHQMPSYPYFPHCDSITHSPLCIKHVSARKPAICSP